MERVSHERRELYECNELGLANDVAINSVTSTLQMQRQQETQQQQLQQQGIQQEQEQHIITYAIDHNQNNGDNINITNIAIMSHDREINDYNVAVQREGHILPSNIAMPSLEVAPVLQLNSSNDSNHAVQEVISNQTININNNNNNLSRIVNMQEDTNGNNNTEIHEHAITTSNDIVSNNINNNNNNSTPRYSPVELTGVAIENRIRPRSHLPKGTVVVEHDDRQYIIHFSEIEEIPQAAPPPLSMEELEYLEAARNRINSPEFYGRAEYLHGSRANSVKGVSLKRNNSAMSVTSLSAYDSNVESLNKSIKMSRFYNNSNNNSNNNSSEEHKV